MLEHDDEQLYPLGRVMRMPEKRELPFFNGENHDTLTEAESVEMYCAWAEYRENLRTGMKPSADGSDRPATDRERCR